MRTHFGNCTNAPRSVGRIPADHVGDQSLSVRSAITKKSTSSGTASRTGPLSHIISRTITGDERDIIDLKFSNAMHSTATPFSFFEDPVWEAFFMAVAPAWKMPSPARISGELLDRVYDEVMSKTLDKIKSEGGGTMGVDGATDNIAKSKSNVIIHTPFPFFIDYLRGDLGRETTTNVVAKIQDSIKRVNEKTGLQCVTSFISDSCNGMRETRKRLLESGSIKWEYGCGTHCLNNFTEDIGKLLFSAVIKKSVYISKSIKNTGMIRKLFDILCVEKHKKRFIIPLYSKTRWSSVNIMLSRMRMLSSTITYFPHALMHERERLKLDLSYELPDAFVTAVTDVSFWKRVTDAHEVYNHICLCIGALESDDATMSSAYACVLSVRIHINNHPKLSSDEKGHLDAALIRQWKRIFSPMHSLAFKCDYFYKPLHDHVQHNFPSGFVNLDTDLVCACHDAIELLQDDTKHGEKLMHEYLDFCVKPHPMFEKLTKWHPSLVWGQVEPYYPTLSRVLYNVFRAPASTSGVERNHKVNKRVMSSLRCRLGEGRVEKQVSVTHNSGQLKRDTDSKRTHFEEIIARRYVSAQEGEGANADHAEQTDSRQAQGGESVAVHADMQKDNLQAQDGNGIFTDADIDGSFDLIDYGELEMEHNLWDFTDPVFIRDDIIFNNDVDE